MSYTRRGFLGLVTGGTAGIVMPSPGSSTDASHPLTSPPMPQHRFHDFNSGVFVQPSTYAVAHCLDDLGWDSSPSVLPLLVVPVVGYPLALEIRDLFHGALAVLADRAMPEKAWYVTWQGRAIGSRAGYVL